MKLFGSIVFAILSVMVNGKRGNPNANGNPNGTPCIGASGNSGVCGSNSGNDCPNICNALSGGHTGRVRVRTRKF